MGYVGRGLNQEGGQYRKLDSISSNFDGSEVSFNLTIDGLEVTPTAQNLLISLGGVIQEPGTAFSVVGSTITFASAPDSSATFFGVLMGEASFIARGTVGAAEMGITAGAVTASAGLVVDSAKNLIGFNNISASKFEGTFSGALSSSAQIADNISGSSAEPPGNVSGSSTSTGSFGKVEVGSGKITTAGNMTLDADGAQFRFEDGGTEFGRISRVSSDLVIKSISNNNDILFKGVDGSSTITALQLDMSEAGNAIFNNDVTIAGTLTAQEIHTEFESASILFTSGSTIFGNSTDDTHLFSGSVAIHNGEVGVAAGSSADELVIKNNGDAGISILSPNGNSSRIQFGSVSDNDIGHIGGFYNSGNEYLFFSVDGSTRMVIGGATSAGNVGIGTDNPTVALEVFGSADQQIRIDSTANRAQLQFDGKKTSDAEFAEINFANDGDSAAAIHAMRDGANDAARLAFFTQPTGGSVTERMSVDSTGNVGIGTTGPGAVLHVDDNSSTAYNGAAEVGETVIFRNKNGSDDSGVNNVVSIGLQVADGATSQGFINYVRTGNNTGEFTFSQRTASSTYAEHMRIDSSGKVGIGNDNPPQPLTVEGNISGSGTGSFAVLKTGDLELENERGHWSIVEEAEYLSIRNVKTNKMYKFVLEEIE